MVHTSKPSSQIRVFSTTCSNRSSFEGPLMMPLPGPHHLDIKVRGVLLLISSKVVTLNLVAFSLIYSKGMLGDMAKKAARSAITKSSPSVLSRKRNTIKSLLLLFQLSKDTIRLQALWQKMPSTIQLQKEDHMTSVEPKQMISILTVLQTIKMLRAMRQDLQSSMKKRKTYP